MKRILLLTLLFSLHASGQNKLLIGVGADYPVYGADYDSPLHRLWRTGVNTTLSTQLPVLGPLGFRPALSYHYYFFHQYEQSIYAGSKAIRSEGTGYQLVSMGGELCLQEKEGHRFRPALLLGGGYTVERPGTMKITWLEIEGNGGTYTTSGRVPNRSYWYVTLGLDNEYAWTKELSITLSFKYYTNKLTHPYRFRSYESYYLLNFGLNYSLAYF